MNQGLESGFLKPAFSPLRSREYFAAAVPRRRTSARHAVAGSSTVAATTATGRDAAWRMRCRSSRDSAASPICGTRRWRGRRRAATGSSSSSISTRWSTGIAEAGIIPSESAGSGRAGTGARRNTRPRRLHRTASLTDRPRTLTGRNLSPLFLELLLFNL